MPPGRGQATEQDGGRPGPPPRRRSAPTSVGALAGAHPGRPRRRASSKVELDGGDVGRTRGPFAGGGAGADRALRSSIETRTSAASRSPATPTDGRRRDRRAVRGRRRAGREPAAARAPTLGPRARRGPGAPSAPRPRGDRRLRPDGPRARWRLEALPAFAASGALFASGFADRPPCWLPGYLAHDCAAALRAWWARSRPCSIGRARAAARPSRSRCRRRRSTRSIPGRSRRRLRARLSDAAGRRAAQRRRRLLGAARRRRLRARAAGEPRGSGAAFVELPRRRRARAAPEWEACRSTGSRTPTSIRRSPATTLRDAAARRACSARGRALDVPIVPVNRPEDFVRGGADAAARRYFRATGFPHVGDAPFARAAVHAWTRRRRRSGVRRRAALGDAPRGFAPRADAAPSRGGATDPVRSPACASSISASASRGPGGRLAPRRARRGGREDRVAREPRLPARA